mgnify:CR=1 FL=1
MPQQSITNVSQLQQTESQNHDTPINLTPTTAKIPPISQRTPGLSPSKYSVPPPTPVAEPQLPEPVVPHWFYLKEGRKWTPFSRIDSESLELASQAAPTGKDRIVPTDGGRYDVNLDKRLQHAIYWDESVSVVRRCSWFCKGSGESKLTPYTEDLSSQLEVFITLVFYLNS